jgi:hypothetical protein
MQRRWMIWVMAAGVLCVSAGVPAGWQDLLKSATDSLTGVGDSSQVSSLTNAEMNGGLKDALAVGVERAINGLGSSGGYLDDPAVRIPLPGALQKTEKALRLIGQGAAVDEFIVTVNRAAERAIPQASKIVGNAVRDMTITDAQKILTGPDDAATQYFRGRTTGDLTTAMLPIVKRATESAGVTRAYKGLLDKAGPASSLVGDSLDLDAYVTEKTLDGLFLKVADEERAIRTNPVARSTDLLKKVFGAVER